MNKTSLLNYVTYEIWFQWFPSIMFSSILCQIGKLYILIWAEFSNISISWFLPPTNLVFSPRNSCCSWKKSLFANSVWLEASCAASNLSSPSISSRNLERYLNKSYWYLLWKQPEYFLNPRNQKNGKWERRWEEREWWSQNAEHSPRPPARMGSQNSTQEEFWTQPIMCSWYTEWPKCPTSELLNECPG